MASSRGRTVILKRAVVSVFAAVGLPPSRHGAIGAGVCTQRLAGAADRLGQQHQAPPPHCPPKKAW
jgi:hypothetical protein